LDKIIIGQEVTASINLRGRKWTDKDGNDKYFNTIEAWKIFFGETKASINQEEDGDVPF